MLPLKLRLVTLCCLVSLCSLPTFTQAEEDGPAVWDEIQAAAMTLVEEDRIDDALALIARRAPEMPDRAFEVSDLTLTLLFEAGRLEDAMTAWEKGLDDGFFYFVIPRQATYDTIRNGDRFKTALARNNALRDRANDGSKPEYEVITPASYSPDRSYPLVMIIHGGNQSIVKAMGRWDPQAIGDDYIIAYVQSSRQADSKSFRWDLGGLDIYSRATAQDEVLGLYHEIVGRYAVDTERVTLAGFSQGGNLSLIMAAEGTIPAKGFIAGCPATRSSISLETAQAAAARGLRGTLFVGARDWTAAASQTSVDNFNEAGVAVDHIVMEDKGHEFPDDFDAVIREALLQIHR